jgi:hypothetical protein
MERLIEPSNEINPSDLRMQAEFSIWGAQSVRAKEKSYPQDQCDEKPDSCNSNPPQHIAAPRTFCFIEIPGNIQAPTTSKTEFIHPSQGQNQVHES